MSNSLQPMDCSIPGFPVLWLPPGVGSNSCPLSQWCHPTISTLSSPSHPALNLSQHQGLFQWVNSSHQVSKVLGLLLQHQSFQWIFRADSYSIWSPCCPTDSQESSPTSQFKTINSLVLSLLYGLTLTSVHKSIALTIWTFVGKAMSLLFNVLSRFIIAFLPRSKFLLISWLQSPSTVILEPKKRKCHCFHFFPFYLPWYIHTCVYVCINDCFFQKQRF